MAMIISTRGRRLFIFPGAVRLTINGEKRVVNARLVANAWVGLIIWGCITSFVSAFIGAFMAQLVGIPWRWAVAGILGVVWVVVFWLLFFWWNHRNQPLLAISDDMMPSVDKSHHTRHLSWHEIERIELHEKKPGYFDSTDSFRPEMSILLHTVQNPKPIILTMTHSRDNRLSDYKRVNENFTELSALHDQTAL